MNNTQTSNPFAITGNTRTASTAIGESSSAREVADVQAAMVIAQKFPRDPIAATDRILQACTRPTLAEGALYQYSRGGSSISGPSIRLAEACAQSWGNLSFGIRELDQNNGSSTVEAYAHDLETNTRQVKVFQVEHKRYTRKGSYALEDPRDIYELVANQGSRRLRACILGVIPGDVIEAAVHQCEKTLSSHADVSEEGIKKLVEAFKAFGVSTKQIEARCQCRLQSIRPAQVVQLRKIYQSLRDEMSTPEDWFDAAKAGPVGTVSAEQSGALQQAAREHDVNLQAVLQDMGLSTVSEIPAARFQLVLDRIKNSRPQSTNDDMSSHADFIAEMDGGNDNFLGEE